MERKKGSEMKKVGKGRVKGKGVTEDRERGGKGVGRLRRRIGGRKREEKKTGHEDIRYLASNSLLLAHVAG